MSSSRRTSTLFVAAPALAVILSACALNARPSPFDRPDPERISVVVENNGFYDVTVYVESNGGRFRLGAVRGCTAETFVPPSDFVGAAGTYHLVAVYSGHQRSVRTHPIEVVPGATTVWSLEQSEWLSTVSIR